MNEMDQLTRFRGTVPLGTAPRAEQLFRAALHDENSAPRPLARTRRMRRRTMAISSTAGVLIAAAAVAVALVAIPAARPPAAPPGRLAGGHPASATSPLTQLAAFIMASPRQQPGNATLVIRTTTLAKGDAQAGTTRVFDLFTDRGAYYFARTRSGLPGQIAAHHALGGGIFAREIAAAKYAVHGDLAIARARMAGGPNPPTKGMYPDAVAAKAAELGVKPAPGQSLRAAVNRALTDESVWENSLDALVAGAGNAQVRAGVLRLISTVSGITVSHGTSGRPATLVVARVMPGATPSIRYREALTLNAHTGIPIAFTGGAVGKAPDVTISYRVSRVTVTAVAAGKF